MKRKYNHNSLLAKSLAKHYSKTVIHNALYKKPTTSQTKLNLAERKKNLKNSFIFNQKAKSLIKGKRILLLDDITTSGTTLLECAKTLNTAETAPIIPAVIAHTPRNIKTLTKDKTTL